MSLGHYKEIQLKVYDIIPNTKPRMTQRDRWAKRPCVLKYFAFKDEVKLNKIELPEAYHVIFILPMPKSWGKKKKADMDGQPHKQTPDKDNLEKALLDAIYGDDSHKWDGRATKMWGKEGRIIVKEIEPFAFKDIKLVAIPCSDGLESLVSKWQARVKDMDSKVKNWIEVPSDARSLGGAEATSICILELQAELRKAC